ncbi:MAG: tol-pal system YbgF family protein [Phycisphaerae bacterium]
MIALTTGSQVRADQVIYKGASHPAVTIVGFERGMLIFDGLDGVSHTVPISDVDMIIVDRAGMFTDFNQAERLLARGEAEHAITRYRRTLRLSEAFWSDLIAARLLVACDRAGRIDQATLGFIRLASGSYAGPEAAAMLIPQNIPSDRTPKALRAIDHLDAAIAEASHPNQSAPLAMLRYKIMSTSGDGRAAAAARTVTAMKIPSGQQSEAMYAIQLDALRRRAANKLDAADRAGLERAIRDCPDRLLPDFLLLKGRTLARGASTQADLIRASWPFMHIVAHAPQDARAAEGLYETALLLERLGQREKAAQLLDECLAHKRVDPRTQRLAKERRARLKESYAS